MPQDYPATFFPHTEKTKQIIKTKAEKTFLLFIFFYFPELDIILNIRKTRFITQMDF